MSYVSDWRCRVCGCHGRVWAMSPVQLGAMAIEAHARAGGDCDGLGRSALRAMAEMVRR